MSSREENKMLFPFFNLAALRMANLHRVFCCSECNRVKMLDNLMMYLQTLNLYVTIKVIDTNVDKNGLCGRGCLLWSHSLASPDQEHLSVNWTDKTSGCPFYKSISSYNVLT